MSEHTPGPLTLTQYTNYVGWSAYGQPGTGCVAERWYDIKYSDENNEVVSGSGRLMVAAYNSYDKHCGKRAVECAEEDLLGEALEACRMFAGILVENGWDKKLPATHRLFKDLITKAEGR